MTDVPQLTGADLKTMSQAAIAQALREGRCADLLAGVDPSRPAKTAAAVPEGQIGQDELAAMTPEQIVEADRAGRLDYLQGRHPDAAA